MTIWTNIAKNIASWANQSKNSATWTNTGKGGIISQLWSSTYLPWAVDAYPWLNENTVSETIWTNVNKS